MSLKQELEKKSISHKKTIWIISGIAGVIILYGLISYFSGITEDGAIVVVPSEYTIRKGEITIGLESEGVIKGSNTLALGFEGSGRMTSIKKNIGDTVKSGEIIATIDDTSARIELQKARNSLSQAIANYSIKVKPLSALEKEQIEGSLAMNQITYENKILGFEKEIATSEKTIQDLEKKLKDYEDDLRALIGTSSNDPGSTNEKDFAIQITDAYQTIKQNLITIDDFLGVSDDKRTINDKYENLIAGKNAILKSQAEDLWRQLNTVKAPANIILSQDIIDQTLRDITKMRQLLSTMIDVMDATVPDGFNLNSTTVSTNKSTYL